MNYNTLRYLHTCLSSLLDCLADTGVPHRVMVLENGSGDDLSNLQAEFSDAVEFYFSPVNRGFGGGHNLLADQGRSRLLCCVNPDVVVPQGAAFSRLLDAFAHPGVAVVGPALLTGRGERDPWDHGELRGLRARVANGAGHSHWRARSHRVRAAWVSGAFMLVRREVFDAVGRFDESYFLYKEEEDLCLQIRRQGYKVVYEPNVAVTHLGSVVAKRDPAHFVPSIRHYNAKNFSSQVRRRALEWLYLNLTRRL